MHLIDDAYTTAAVEELADNLDFNPLFLEEQTTWG